MPANGTVEERIVEMRIDNKQFEAGAKRTLGILESIDKGLNALGENNAGNFDKIGTSLDVVTNRFSAMGIVGDQVLRNLTNKAMDLVNQIMRTSTELSAGQIGPGWNKYAEKTRSVQTIMAATAKDVGTLYGTVEEQMAGVNAQLDKLNWFTDETSYSFLDMVNNIGKFTSVGVALDDSVTAMEGISTWAAISGATVTEAGRAMYNLSQAMGLGAVTAIDWKSIENANMATREFKETAIQAAVELGTLQANADGTFTTLQGHTFATEGFREYLSDKWFSSDVLVQTLKYYGDFTDLLHEAQEVAGMETKEILKHLDAYADNREEYIKSKDAIEELLPYLEQLTSEEYDLGRRAFRAAQEAKTFDEAIDATKDAVSTTWMGIFETIFGGYLDAKNLWTEVAESLYNIFAVPVSHIKDVVDAAFSSIKDSLPFSGLNDWLSKMNSSLPLFTQAFTDVVGSDEVSALVAEYGSLDAAMKAGAIDAKTFHEVLVQMASNAAGFDFKISGDAFGEVIDRITKAGYSLDSFFNALEENGVEGASAIRDLVAEFGAGGLEMAFRNGMVSVDQLQAAFARLAFPALTGVGPDSIDSVKKKIEELRTVAIDGLSGKYGYDQDKRDALEALGYDPDMIHDIATALHQSRDADIAALLQEKYPEYIEELAKETGLATDQVAEMIAYLQDSDALWEVLATDLSDYKDGGELFSEALLNLLHVFEQIGEAFQTAFDMIFGGSDDAEEAAENMGNGLYYAIAAFHDFTEAIQLVKEGEDGIADTSRFDTLVDILAAVLQIGRVIGKVFGLAFNIIGRIVGLGARIIGYILPYVANALWSIADLVTTIFYAFAESGALSSVGEALFTVLQALSAPLLLIADGISKVFNWLKQRNIIQTFGTILLTVFGALLSPAILLADSISKIFNILRNSKFISAAKKRFDEFAASLKSYGDTVRITVGNNGLKGLFNLLRVQINAFIAEHPALEKIFNKISVFFNTVKKPVKQVINALDQFFVKAKNIGKSIVYGYSQNGFAGAFENIHYWIERFLRDHPMLSSALGKISGFFRAIGGYISSAFAILKSQFEQVRAVYSKNGFAGVFDLFKAHVKAFLAEHPALEKIFNSLYKIYLDIRNIASSAFDTLRSNFPTVDKIGKKIDEWKDKIKKNGLFETLQIGITQKLSDIRSAFAEIDFSKANSVLGQIGAFFSGITVALFGDPKELKQKIHDFIHNAWVWFLEGIRDLKLRDVLGALRFVKIASLLLSLADLMHVILGIGKEAKAVPETINETFKKIGESVTGAFESLGSMFDRTRLLTLAFAVGIVSASLWLLSKVPSDRLVEVAAVMVIVMLALSRFAKSVNKISEIKNISIRNFQVFGTIGSILIGLGILIAAIASAVFKLAYIKDLELLDHAMMSIIAIIGAVAALIYFLVKQLNKISTYKRMTAIGDTLKSIAIAMILIGVAIGLLVRSVGKIVALITSYGGTRILQSGAVLAGIAGIIVIVMLFMRSILDSKQKDNDITPARMTALGTNLIKIAAAMLIIVVAIQMLIIPLAIIAALTAALGPGAVWSGIGALAVFGVLLGGIMAGLAAIMAKKGTGPEKIIALGTNLVKIAAAMLIVSVAIGLLVIPLTKIIQIFDAYGPGLTWAAFGMIAAFFVMFSALMIIMTKILTAKGIGGKIADSAGTALLKAAGAMALISVAILLLIRPLKVITKLMYEYPIGVVWAAFGMIVALVAVIGGIIWLLSKFTPGGEGGAGKIIAIGGAFALIALGINLLVPALAAMIGLATGFVALANSFSKLGNNAAYLAIAVVALLVLGTATFFAGAGLLMASVGALLLVGVAWLMAFALEHLAEVMPSVAESMKEFGDMLRDPETLKSIGLAALVFVVLAAAVIALIFGLSKLFKNTGVGAKFAAFGTTVGKGATIVMSKLGTALVNGGAALWNKLKDVLVKNLPLILKFLGFMAFSAVLYVLDLIPDLVYLLVKGLVDLLNAFAESIRSNSGAILHAITNALSAILELLVKAIGWGIGALINLLGGTIIDAILGILDTLSDKFGFIGLGDWVANAKKDLEAAKDTFSDMGENMGDAMAEGIRRHLVYGEEVEVVRIGGEKRNAEDYFSEASEMSGFDVNAQFEVGEEIGEESGEAGAKGLSTGYTGGFLGYLKSFGSQFGANVGIEDKIGNFLGSIFGGDGIDIEGALSGILGGDGIDLTGLLENYIGEGGDLSDIGLDNMLTMTGLDEEALKSQIGDKLYNGLLGAGSSDAVAEASETVAESIEENAEEGLDKQQGKLTEALIGVVVASAGDVANAPETKKAMENNGEYMVSGMADGVYKGLPKLLDSVDYVSNRAAERFQVKNLIKSPSRLYAKLASFIPLGIAKGIKGNEDEAEDSITVMASGMLSAMQAAMLKLGMLTDERFDVQPTIRPVVDLSDVTVAAGSAGRLFGNLKTGLRGSISVGTESASSIASSIDQNRNTSAILGEVSRLSSKLDELGDRITNMQIIMDTGALVGATAGPMDTALGKISVRRGRGR